MKQILLLFTFLLPFCGYAQLTESFDGPEINSSYPWLGNIDRFIINEQGELQLNGRYFTDEVYIYLQSLPLLNNEWQCKVRSDYEGTPGNYFRIFLWMEKPDWEYPGETLFVRIGYTRKNIELCYQLGNRTPEILIQGEKRFEGPHQVEVRVVTDEEGRCILYSRTSDTEDFVEEGSVDLPFYSKAKGYFMVWVKHSKDHNKNKFIDDIFIERFNVEEKEETELPELLRVEEVSSTELNLHFNKPIAYYTTVSLNELGEATDVWTDIEYTTLIPVWEKPMQKGQEYTLTYEVYDEEENKCQGDYSFTSTLGSEEEDPEKPTPSASGKILINEIMADPKGAKGLPETEYVELYNISEEDIELDGWSFQYGDNKPVELDDYIFPADSYLILYRAGREITTDESAGIMPLDKFPSQLANAGKSLFLYDADSNLVDEITYEKAKAGIAWERSEEGWHLSTDAKGGTPGCANSSPGGEDTENPNHPEEPENPSNPEGPTVYPNDIIFNELLPEPFSEGSEYIELYNRSDHALLLTGLSIATRKTDGTLSTRYSLSDVTTYLFPGEYVLLTKEIFGVTEHYSIPTTTYMSEIKLPALNNSGSTLVLFRSSDETIIDEITYSPKWHDPSVKNRKGVSLERIDPDKETQLETNWTSAAAIAGYGTPGYKNSQHGQPKGEKPGENETTGIDEPQYSRETGLYSIRYYLDQPGYNCRASVYNLSGQRVATLINNELIGTQGELIWNGTNTQGNSLKPGPYIFHMELYHTQGTVKTFKEVFLVH